MKMEARDVILRETKRQVIKESRILERTRSALMREIRSGATEFQPMDVMKVMRQEKDNRIEQVLQQISGAMNQ